MRYIAALIFFLGFNTTFAQHKVLTFEEAVRIALKNSVTLNQQKNNVAYNQMQKLSGIAGLGPTLTASAGVTQVNGNFFNQNAGQVVNGLFDQVSGSVNANLNIFSGFNQFNRMRQYSSQLEAQAFYVNRTAQDVISTISIQYLQVLLDEELLRIAQQNFEVLKNQLEQVKEQVNVGSKSPVDEYNQDSQARAAEVRALQAEINLINDKALLTQTLLMDPTDEIDLMKPDWNVNIVESEEMELQSLYETSLKHRGDYLRAVKLEEASRFSMHAARGNLFPSLSAFASVNSFYNRLHGDPNTAPFDEQFKTSNLRKVYGLQLFIPIFGGQVNLQNRTNVVLSKSTYLNNQLARRNAEIQVKTDVSRAYQNFKLYRSTFGATVAQLEAAEKAFALESERYNLGITNFVDYIQANKNLVQAQTDKAQAEYRLVFQKVVMDYVTGIQKTEL